jgi:RimJ/RimL family protein N-acetyltransferase
MTRIYETDRLIMRRLASTDLDAFAALCANPEVMQYIGDGATLSISMARRWLLLLTSNYAIRPYDLAAAVRKADNTFIGFIGVNNPDPEDPLDEIMLAVDRPYWRNGYASEMVFGMFDYSFYCTDITEIWASIYEENAVTHWLTEKFNMPFVYEKIMPNGNLSKFYRMQRADWHNQDRAYSLLYPPQT